MRASSRVLPVVLAAVLSLSAFLRAAMAEAADEGGSGKDKVNIPLDGARPPGSPAFALLGIEPTAIERPTTPRALAVSLLSAVGEGNPLPKSYAIEIVPLWLFRQPTITYEDRYGGKPFGTFLDTLTISLATYTPDEEDALTRLGVGVRAQLFGGRAEEEMDGAKSRLVGAAKDVAKLVECDNQVESTTYACRKWQRELKDWEERRQERQKRRIELHEQLDSIRKQRHASVPQPGVTPVDLAGQAGAVPLLVTLDSQEADLEHQLEALAGEESNDPKPEPVDRPTKEKRLKALDEARAAFLAAEQRAPVGFMLEAAGGTVVDVPGEDFGDASLGRWGAWIVASYRWDDLPMSFLSLGRFLRDVPSGSSSVDVGGRLVYQPREDFAMSMEYVQRFNLSGPWPERTYRAAGVLEHRLAESTYLTATIGKDLDEGEGTLLSLLGLRVDVGKKPQATLDLKK